MSDEAARDIERAHLSGIHILKERFRFYPEGEAFAHVTGFVSPSDDGVPSGKYGVEGFFDTVLAGSGGYRFQEARCAWAMDWRWRAPNRTGTERTGCYPHHGSRRTICGVRPVEGSRRVIRSRPWFACHPQSKNGNVIAMCGAPTYDPNVYNEVESIEVYNNQTTFVAYEPGSVFKPLVMAAAIDLNVVSPTDFLRTRGKSTSIALPFITLI